jgi:hypothetical protein
VVSLVSTNNNICKDKKVSMNRLYPTKGGPMAYRLDYSIETNFREDKVDKVMKVKVSTFFG